MPDTTAIDVFMHSLSAAFGVSYTPWRQDWLREWARNEGTAARFNPLASTLKWGASTPFNSAGVQNYASFSDGVAATKATLDPHSFEPSWIDYYPDLRAALLNENLINLSGIIADLRDWGTVNFAAELEGGWRPPSMGQIPDQPPVPVVTLGDVTAVLTGSPDSDAFIRQWIADGDSLLLGYDRLFNAVYILAQDHPAALRALNGEPEPEAEAPVEPAPAVDKKAAKK